MNLFDIHTSTVQCNNRVPRGHRELRRPGQGAAEVNHLPPGGEVRRGVPQHSGPLPQIQEPVAAAAGTPGWSFS